MHSSILRGSDFHLCWQGREVSHRDFFLAHARTTRVGTVCAPRHGGCRRGHLGHGLRHRLLRWFATARERVLRVSGLLLTFQRRDRLVDYCYFDFWPDKDVRVPEDRNATVAAIADRAINVLLVPDNPPTEFRLEPVQDERIRRTLTRCFVYSRHGEVVDRDLVVRCAVEPFGTYVANVLRSVDEPAPGWSGTQEDEGPALEQSFRETTVDGALMRL